MELTHRVMGPTGVGKSTFINRASGSNLTVSGGIASCTKDVAASDAFDVDGKTVTLIDTPGFNDTKISRSSLLRRIVTFLTKTYEKGRVPNAIIYLHRISDLRFGGIMRQDFEAFRKIVGVDSEKRIILTTTMWCDVKEEIGRKRELELKADDRFFGEVCKNGAVMVRHDDTRERALEIVRVAMGYPPGKLAVQDETVDKKLSFPETSPARCLRRDFEDQVNKQKKELLELQQQVDE
ncbi:P-loop containing nucleoside triphosphate hydrolase protein, partial [Abortiporus biennis]